MRPPGRSVFQLWAKLGVDNFAHSDYYYTVGEEMDVLSELGKKIKALRKERRMTLQRLASECQISPSMLSEIERGIKLPSLLTLLRIANALDTQASLLMEITEERKSLTRRRRRKVLVSRSPNVTFEAINSPIADGQIQIVRAVAQGREYLTVERQHTHPGEECILVQKGTVRVVLSDETLMLEPGDCICFSSDIPHTVQNAGEGEAELLWIMSPPSFL